LTEDPQNAVDYELVLVPTRRLSWRLPAIRYQTVVLKPVFEDCVVFGLQKETEAFIVKKTLSEITLMTSLSNQC
jgi:hypothetical protein